MAYAAGWERVQLYGGGDHERDRCIRQWRTCRIKRFKERQDQLREWINFAEIAEWHSEVEGLEQNRKKSDAAFDTLEKDLLAGVFEQNGRSRVLYLHTGVSRSRMTREWLRDAINGDYDGECGRSSPA